MPPGDIYIRICIRWAGRWWAELQSCKVDRCRTDESTADSGVPAGESCAVNSLHGNNIPCRRRGGTPGKFTRQPSLDCSILWHVKWIDFLLKVAAALHFSVFACVLCSICNTVSSITVPQITARLNTSSGSCREQVSSKLLCEASDCVFTAVLLFIVEWTWKQLHLTCLLLPAAPRDDHTPGLCAISPHFLPPLPPFPHLLEWKPHSYPQNSSLTSVFHLIINLSL